MDLRQRRKWISICLGHIALVVIAGCQAPSPAPVDDRPQPPTDKILYHIVSAEETLYTIAWRLELDAERLAAINGLQRPYRLQPGQRLSLDLNNIGGGGPVSSAATAYPVGGGAVRTYPVGDAPVVSGGVEEPPVVAGATTPSGPVEDVIAPPVSLSSSPPPPLQQATDWQWPASGRVVREYDAGKVLKGISIYTDQGTSVAAAATGVVVYAGDGLRGYGNLLIVKHSEKHLSAYAHNKSLLVKENENVRQGQKIAEVGVDASKQNRLYFEIRENGKPIDPLKLLPSQ